LVFNPVTMRCDPREVVPECHNFEEQTTTQSNAVSCVYDEKHPLFALTFCGRTYGACSEQGILEQKECNISFLFDSHLNTCVPAEQCGQERLKDLLSKVIQAGGHSFTSEKKKDDRCRNTAEGEMKPLGRCRSSYIRCVDGKAVIEPCSTAAEVFSAAIGMCVLRINAPECHKKPQRTSSSQSASSDDPTAFCRSRTDGLYRNPTNCAGILQCFGGDIFEYPSCSSGLVFNEQTGKCDYRDSGCRGANHGDFVADESNCQQFYRCVWDRLERMQCPSGTVFNPELSVCDWPVNVPLCPTFSNSSIEQ
uniref:Chitin-binding type-2 domain-containing protein n=1 Tax=Angiostrongylus cantonensis TaxID=6313 RepID=A0A0K0D7A4_ANGCA